jgi:hypothetical protein
MSTNTSEPTKEVMNKELMMFRRFQMDVKDIKCFFRVVDEHKSFFPNVAFLAC